MKRLEVGQKQATLPVVAHPSALALGQVNAVAEERARAEQPGAVVDVEIVAGSGKPRRHGRDLGVVLGEMGLQPAVGMLGQERSGCLELGLARGHGEARRDGVAEPALAVPARDQRLAVVVAALRRVAQALGPVVHHDLAGERAACRGPSAAAKSASTEPAWTVG